MISYNYFALIASHTIGGFFMLIALAVFVIKFSIIKLNIYHLIVVLLFLSLAFTVHGISHAFLYHVGKCKYCGCKRGRLTPYNKEKFAVEMDIDNEEEENK